MSDFQEKWEITCIAVPYGQNRMNETFLGGFLDLFGYPQPRLQRTLDRKIADDSETSSSW
jgi:hypothetical protein